MENRSDAGISGQTFDAFVSSQRRFDDYDFAAKIQEKYWRAKQKFLAKIEKKEDSNIILSDSKIDAKLGVGRNFQDYYNSSLTKIDRYQVFINLIILSIISPVFTPINMIIYTHIFRLYILFNRYSIPLMIVVVD